MVEAATRAGLIHLSPTQDGIKVLKELAINSFNRISTARFRNGLSPASVGRHDDDHYDGMVWIKDSARAVRFAVDSNFQKAFPELLADSKRLYLSSIRALLQIQGQPEQLRRFQSRPGLSDQDGYSTIDDRLTPAIKFTKDGYIYQDWGHNQPDNWGTLLLTVGKGIEIGWPVLGRGRNQPLPLGAILQEITSYVVNLKTERFVCRSIWEHKNVWSSYSTRRIVLAGLDQVRQVWPELVSDSKKRGYQLRASQLELEDSAGRLREKVKEYFPADYTDAEGHESAADLASLVVQNDIDDLPPEEQMEIIGRTVDLENRLGFYRYLGDPYRLGRAEAKWTMGKPIMARHFFLQSLRLYTAGKAKEAFRALDHGLDRINDLLDIKTVHGYIPELFEDRNNDGTYRANNNELAWTLGYIIEAAGVGVAAISQSEQFYRDQEAA